MHLHALINPADLARGIDDKLITARTSVAAVLDDRDSVVAMWRAMGLTCLQVAPGAF